MPTVAPILTDRLYLDALPETTWADGGSGTAVLLPMKDGDYTVALDKPSRDQQHVVGDVNATYNVPTRRDLKGGLKIGLFPHVWETMLAWAVDRDSSNELASKTLRRTFPGLQTVEHVGMKVNSVSIEGSEEGDVDMMLDLQGAYERPRAAGIVAYPGAYTVPNYPSLTFADVKVIACLASDLAGAGTRIAPVGVKSFSLALGNNLKPGQPTQNRATKNRDKAIAFLVTGRQSLTAKLTASFDRTEYLTLDQDDLYFWFKVIGAHPSYSAVATIGADATAGAAVNITVDSSTGFVVGDVVYGDAAGGTTLPWVGVVSAVPDATHITITTLDENAKINDHIYNAAVEFKTAVLRTPSMPKSTAYGDFVTVELNGDSFSGGAGLLTRKTKDMAVPA